MPTLLKRRRVSVIESPVLVDLVEHCEFDTIYHEHLCYFSVTALNHSVPDARAASQRRRALADPRRLAAPVRRAEGRRLRTRPRSARRRKRPTKSTAGVLRDFASRVAGIRDLAARVLTRSQGRGAAASPPTVRPPRAHDAQLLRHRHRHDRLRGRSQYPQTRALHARPHQPIMGPRPEVEPSPTTSCCWPGISRRDPGTAERIPRPGGTIHRSRPRAPRRLRALRS